MYDPSLGTPTAGTAVNYWTNQSARLYAGFCRVAWAAISHRPPASRLVSQEVLHRWEGSAKNDSYVFNQAAGLSRGLRKVLEDINSHFKVIRQSRSVQQVFNDAVFEL